MSRSATSRLLLAQLAAIGSLLLWGCQPQPQARTQSAEAVQDDVAWPNFDYVAASAEGNVAFQLDPSATQIDILVRRDGPLARFGHDHVLTVEDPEGYLLMNPEGLPMRADLRFIPQRLEVDSPTARAQYALDTTPTAADIAGTRDNLMEHVLDTTQWPWASLALSGFQRQQDHYSALVTVAINGSNYSERQPFRLRSEDNRVVVEGFLVLRQTALGIEPFSVLGGGLRVADPLEVHYHIEARKR